VLVRGAPVRVPVEYKTDILRGELLLPEFLAVTPNGRTTYAVDFRPTTDSGTSLHSHLRHPMTSPHEHA